MNKIYQLLINILKIFSPTKQRTEALVRLVCAEQNMSQQDTEIIVALSWAESSMNPKAINHNRDGSCDFGILQINSFYWIGIGKDFISSQFVEDNPDACVRWLCQKIKTKGQSFYENWITYRTGAYKKYLKT